MVKSAAGSTPLAYSSPEAVQTTGTVAFLAKLPRCLVGIEACALAHYTSACPLNLIHQPAHSTCSRCPHPGTKADPSRTSEHRDLHIGYQPLEPLSGEIRCHPCGTHIFPKEEAVTRRSTQSGSSRTTNGQCGGPLTCHWKRWAHRARKQFSSCPLWQSETTSKSGRSARKPTPLLQRPGTRS
jgi:hypothetical protein